MVAATASLQENIANGPTRLYMYSLLHAASKPVALIHKVEGGQRCKRYEALQEANRERRR